MQDAKDAGKPINLAHFGFKGKKSVSLRAIGKKARAMLVANIPGLADLTFAASQTARDQGWVRGLDGRKLWSRSPHSALNLVLQSAGIILMKRAAVIAEDKLAAIMQEDQDYGLVMQVHDELVYEALPEHAERVRDIVQDAIAEAGEQLGFRLPHLGTGKIGQDWSQVH